jgi:hypothetical protein
MRSDVAGRVVLRIGVDPIFLLMKSAPWSYRCFNCIDHSLWFPLNLHVVLDLDLDLEMERAQVWV